MMLSWKFNEELDDGALKDLKQKNIGQYDLLLAAERRPIPSYLDLSAEFGLPMGTVKSRLNRARIFITSRRNTDEKAKAEAAGATSDPAGGSTEES